MIRRTLYRYLPRQPICMRCIFLPQTLRPLGMPLSMHWTSSANGTSRWKDVYLQWRVWCRWSVFLPKSRTPIYQNEFSLSTRSSFFFPLCDSLHYHAIPGCLSPRCSAQSVPHACARLGQTKRFATQADGGDEGLLLQFIEGSSKQT